MSTTTKRTRKGGRLLWLLRVLRARERGGPGLPARPATRLDALEDSRRELLFKRLPRMLRDDGRMAGGLPPGFRYIDEDDETAPAGTVSRRRWRRAMAMSRTIARRRARTDRPR